MAIRTSFPVYSCDACKAEKEGVAVGDPPKDWRTYQLRCEFYDMEEGEYTTDTVETMHICNHCKVFMLPIPNQSIENFRADILTNKYRAAAEFVAVRETK